MPLDPEDLDGVADEVAAHYSALELAVLVAVAEVARQGIGKAGWAAQQQRLFPRLAATIRRIMDSGTMVGQQLAAEAIREARRRGIASAVADIAAIEAVNPAALAQLAGALDGDLPTSVDGPSSTPTPEVAARPRATQAAARASTTVGEALATAGKTVTSRALSEYQRVVREVARAELAGEATSLQVQQRALDGWAKKGLPAFTDKAGRTWSMQTYAEMSVRAHTHEVFGDAHRAELQDAGLDLVIVSSHRNPADVCQPYERKVLSMSGRFSGTVQVPSAVGDELVTVGVYSSLDAAKARGYGHPNCKHILTAMVPGVSRPGGTRPNPTGYAATQEQRRLERGIREWKRREAVALTDDARATAKAKVKEWQGRTREHVKLHGLDRRYYREAVRTGTA